MYLQIMEQIKQRITVGDWAEGQPIPSIRQLAVDLQVSVITVKRAYLELEREGVIVTQQGKGSHVAPAPASGRGCASRNWNSIWSRPLASRRMLGIRPKNWKAGCAKPATVSPKRKPYDRSRHRNARRWQRVSLLLARHISI